MNNCILKSLSVENFASFADKIQFTTLIDSRKKDTTDFTMCINDELYNKVSYIYGANGSGKTFFCKILREIQRLIDWSPLTAMNNSHLLELPHFKGINSTVPHFAFDVKYENEPTSFGIEIVVDKIYYHYNFSVFNQKVIYERLTKKYKRTEKLLERTTSSYKDIVLKSEFKNFEPIKQVVKEEALALPVAALLNNKLATKIINAIKSIQIVSMTAARIQPTDSKKAFSDERLEKYAEILSKADPTIRKMTVSFSEEEVSREKIEIDDFENREIIAKKTTVEVNSEHAVYENGAETSCTPIKFFTDESLGTIKLFTTLPYLYDVLESGTTLIIDEIENGLHLSLVKEIIDLFKNPVTNPNNAQLICTSHQPLLITPDTRRDQVWIISKNNFGKSSLSRMSNMKTAHSKINLQNKILEGAFGCNPEKFF